MTSLLFLFTAATLLAARFTTSLDRDTIVLGESATFTLNFEEISPGQMPPLPAIPGLQFGGNISSSFNSSSGPDGKMHSVQSYSVPVSASQVGEFQIPALQLAIGGQKFASTPLKLKVLGSDPASPPANFATNIAFVWFTLPKKEIYLGEIIAAELRLYVRSEVGSISDFQPPNLSSDGFISGKTVNGQQFQRRVGNASFTVVPMSFSITPVKSGTFTVGSTAGSVVVHFGPRDFFGNYRQRSQAPLPLVPQTIQVLPLPAENVPPGFNGAVGNFTMTVAAGPTNVATGDPITVRVKISGRGALDALALPEQAAWQDFKTYPPTASVETSDALGLQGTKTFEQVVSPQTTDIKELPALAFSIFDPDTKAYRTLSHSAVKLTVRPGGATTVPTIAAGKNSASDTPPPQQDIVPLKQRLGALAQINPPLIQRAWFFGFLAAPVLLWLAALGWRRSADSLANNPRLRRQRQVAKIIRDGLAELQRLAGANDSGGFFATLFRLLQEQLGERLDCPASSITEAVIEEKLRPRGVEETTLTACHELFQACNLARYAPIKSSQELAAFIPKLEAMLRELQNIRA